MNYSLLHDAYFGSGGFASGAYLTKHKRESDEDYRFRCANAYYLNYFAPIVNALTDPIFKREPLRDYHGQCEDLVQDFLQDVDGNKTSMSTFMKRAAISAKVYGVSFIVVDMPRENTARNVAEMMERRMYPYLTLMSPEDLQEYSIDKSGRLTYVVFREIKKVENGAPLYRYLRYDLDGWRISGDGAGDVSGTYALGCVPVVPLFSRLLEQKTMRPVPDMGPIASTAKALYNHCSWLGEILRNQTFPLLTVPTLDAAELTIGTNNALGYNPESTHQPDFIAPPSDPASVLQTQIASLIQEMYRMASLSFLQSTTTGQQTSGVARQWEFERTNQQLANFAANCKRAEENVLQIFAAWLNSSIEYTVSYPDDFGIVDVEGELKQAQEVLDLGLTPDLRQDVLKKVLAAYCPDIPDERFDELMESLEKADMDQKNSEPPEPPTPDDGDQE